jgi:signal transduction histidine kinase
VGSLRPTGRGLLAEVVASLALVMLAATVVVVVVLFQHGETRLRDVLGRALVAESRSAATGSAAPLLAGTVWWQLDAAGAVRRGDAARLDEETRALAAAARGARGPLLQPGAPWEPIRFAALRPDGGVEVARVPAAASFRLRGAPLPLVAGLLVLDVALFTAFGASLLRRRVVAPLEALAGATRALAEGGFEARLAEEGPRETVAVARAWNAMSEALARRTEALEKAVAELREANHALSVARTGLDRAERLASIGRLAAGVAHEVGNPMGAQLAFLDLARRDPELSEATRANLERAALQGERVRKILRQLLEFSRPPRLERVPVDVAAIAEEAAALVRAQPRYAAVSLVVECEGAAPLALADAGGVAQILLNLVLNAADAVATAKEKRVRLTVRAGVLHVREGESHEAVAALRAPDAVLCRIADTGSGIAPADRERIFDPFFTTKDPGAGTGLGLANSLRLAEELGGDLALADPPEGFTTAFELRLPTERTASACGVRNAMRRGDPAEAAVESTETQRRRGLPA